MNKFRIIIATVILIASLFILIDKLLATQPIHIVLESGQEIIPQNSNYLSMDEVILLLIASFVVGLTSMYIYFKSEVKIPTIIQKKFKKPKINNTILNMLKDNEKKVYIEIFNNGGEILQNSLVKKTNLSRVKITRILSRLELKGLIIRNPYGMTNKILLKSEDFNY